MKTNKNILDLLKKESEQALKELQTIIQNNNQTMLYTSFMIDDETNPRQQNTITPLFDQNANYIFAVSMGCFGVEDTYQDVLKQFNINIQYFALPTTVQQYVENEVNKSINLDEAVQQYIQPYLKMALDNK